nr:ERF family protein [uncultured Mediterranean phage uvMED]
MQAEKDGKNPHFRSAYMTLDGILNKVKPILSSVDIGVMQSIDTNERDVTCTTSLLHVSGQVITGTATVHADKDTPQGFGSAITYARRYGIATLLGIADCEDDDGNGAEAVSKKVVSKPAPTPKPAPEASPVKPKEVNDKLTDTQIKQISTAFSDNLSIEDYSLEKLYGPSNGWTTATRKELLNKYNQLTSGTISIENFLAG